MPFGLGIGQLLGLVRDARGLEQARALVVAGPGAQELASALAATGDRRVIAVNGDPPHPAAVILMLDGEPTDSDLAVLRRHARAGVPLIAVQRGRTADVPYVLPGDVIDARGGDLPVERVARSLAAALSSDDAAALAAALPALRGGVERRIVRRTALANAGIGAAPWLQEAHMPLMTLAQGRMLLELGVAGGVAESGAAQPLARAAGPAVATSVGAGLALRALYRRLPVHGHAVAAAVAFAGTYALGELRARL
jgi:uncharacterized protein (DUF697 family)